MVVVEVGVCRGGLVVVGTVCQVHWSGAAPPAYRCLIREWPFILKLKLMMITLMDDDNDYIDG